MKTMMKRFLTVSLVGTAAAGGLFWSGEPRDVGGFVSTAEARAGRPATPVSYAGVARRSVRTPVAGVGGPAGVGGAGPAGVGVGGPAGVGR